MGAFSDIFGKVPKVLILETLAENSDDELAIRDIIDETGVSKRGVYLIIRNFMKEGLVLESGKRPKKYKLNKKDLRAITLIRTEPLLIMGKLEYELKLDKNIPLNEVYPESYLYDINTEYYQPAKIKTSNPFVQDMENSKKVKESMDYTYEPEPIGA